MDNMSLLLKTLLQAGAYFTISASLGTHFFLKPLNHINGQVEVCLANETNRTVNMVVSSKLNHGGF